MIELTKNCTKFLGYSPFNTLDNNLFLNRDFLLHLYNVYGTDIVNDRLEYCYESLRILVKLLYPEEYKNNLDNFKKYIFSIYQGDYIK